MAELITAVLASLALAAGATGGTVFTVTDEERGLYRMHPELVKEQADD